VSKNKYITLSLRFITGNFHASEKKARHTYLFKQQAHESNIAETDQGRLFCGTIIRRPCGQSETTEKEVSAMPDCVNKGNN
jgi:hypothetical protein